MDCSQPASSVHGILQARILEWVGVPSSRGSSSPWSEPMSLTSPARAGRFFTSSTTWKAPWFLLFDSTSHPTTTPLHLNRKTPSVALLVSVFTVLPFTDTSCLASSSLLLSQLCYYGIVSVLMFHCFSGGSADKESTCNAGDLSSIPDLGRSPGGGKGYPLQYFMSGEFHV